jgi:hypothetical protein
MPFVNRSAMIVRTAIQVAACGATARLTVADGTGPPDPPVTDDIPDRPEDGKGIKGWFFKRYQKKAGGAVPSANRITMLRDTDGDGVPETRSAS